MKKLLHIGNSPAWNGQSTTASELMTFVDEARRLPELASEFKYHRGYLHAQGTNWASKAVYGIANQLSIVDPTIKFQIPWGVTSLVKGLIRKFVALRGGSAGRS